MAAIPIENLQDLMAHVSSVHNVYLAETHPIRKNLLLCVYNASRQFTRMVSQTGQQREVVWQYDIDDMKTNETDASDENVVGTVNGNVTKEEVDKIIIGAFETSNDNEALVKIFKTEGSLLFRHKNNAGAVKKIERLFSQELAWIVLLLGKNMTMEDFAVLMRKIVDYALLEEDSKFRSEGNPLYFMKMFLMSTIRFIEAVNVGPSPPRPVTPEQPNPELPLVAKWGETYVPVWLHEFFDGLQRPQTQILREIQFFEVGGILSKTFTLLRFSEKETRYILDLVRQKMVVIRETDDDEEMEDVDDEEMEEVEMMGAEDAGNGEVRIYDNGRNRSPGTANSEANEDGRVPLGTAQLEFDQLFKRFRTEHFLPGQQLSFLRDEFNSAYESWREHIVGIIRPLRDEMGALGENDFICFLRTYSMNVPTGSDVPSNVPFRVAYQKCLEMHQIMYQKVANTYELWSDTYSPWAQATHYTRFADPQNARAQPQADPVVCALLHAIGGIIDTTRFSSELLLGSMMQLISHVFSPSNPRNPMAPAVNQGVQNPLAGFQGFDPRIHMNDEDPSFNSGFQNALQRLHTAGRGQAPNPRAPAPNPGGQAPNPGAQAQNPADPNLQHLNQIFAAHLFAMQHANPGGQAPNPGAQAQNPADPNLQHLNQIFAAHLFAMQHANPGGQAPNPGAPTQNPLVPNLQHLFGLQHGNPGGQAPNPGAPAQNPLVPNLQHLFGLQHGNPGGQAPNPGAPAQNPLVPNLQHLFGLQHGNPGGQAPNPGAPAQNPAVSNLQNLFGLHHVVPGVQPPIQGIAFPNLNFGVNLSHMLFNPQSLVQNPAQAATANQGVAAGVRRVPLLPQDFPVFNQGAPIGHNLAPFNNPLVPYSILHFVNNSLEHMPRMDPALQAGFRAFDVRHAQERQRDHIEQRQQAAPPAPAAAPAPEVAPDPEVALGAAPPPAEVPAPEVAPDPEVALGAAPAEVPAPEAQPPDNLHENSSEN